MKKALAGGRARIHGFIMFFVWTRTLTYVCTLLLCGVSSRAGCVEISWVTVGDAGNAPDVDTGFGSVDYEYRIGQFEVTTSQYADFLNAVAVDDPNGLYAFGFDEWRQAGIDRFGEPGSYSYAPRQGRELWPMEFISFWDAARFANWMHNGQPAGLQDETTTEDGAYTLTEESIADKSVRRNSKARFFVPTDDEWFKAAYYKSGSLDAGYWIFPTQSDTKPISAEPSDSPNTANHELAVQRLIRSVLVAVPTDVGAYTNSQSSYGTFDQAGNMWEWSETPNIETPGQPADLRGHWGGSYFFNGDRVMSKFHFGRLQPVTSASVNGFRLASIVPPECDFNGDLFCNAADIDQLLAEASTGGTTTDLTGDGMVDNSDRDEWLSLAASENGLPRPFLLGDSNLDGIVDSIDLNAVGVNWQRSDIFAWSQGNYDTEGDPGVNSIDLNTLAVNWQESVPAASRAVPEPRMNAATIALVALAYTFRRKRNASAGS